MKADNTGLQELAAFIQKSRLKRTNEGVTLLPDLFADQIVTLTRTPHHFLSEAAAIVARGGGNYTGATIQLTRGGCAANCAAALSALDVPTSLISTTDPMGLQLLKHTSNESHLDLSHIKTDGKLAATVALETGEKGQMFNIMISDPGSVATFSPNSLDQADYKALKNSSIVGLFSWNLLDQGTELVERVAKFCHENGVQTYLDLGDPVPRIRKLSSLVDRALRKGLIDYLSVNENELRSLNRSLSQPNWQPASLRELAEEIARNLSVEVDLHTPDYSGIFTKKQALLCPAFNVKVRRSTGAGDAWNAGNIFALLKRAEAQTRLLMANLLAGAYVSGRRAEIHSLKSLSGFLKRTKLKRVENLSEG